MAIKIAGQEVIDDNRQLVLAKLKEINTTIETTAVDVFVYDTRKDSDGGAWRQRTQHTSWYNETLNTETRGSRKEFPAVAVIVAESQKVTIYDGDDHSMPMWMVFIWGNRNFIGSFLGSTGVTSLSIKNGLLCIGQNGDGVSSIDFLKETAFKVGSLYVVDWNRTIDRRNENSPTNTNVYDKAIASRYVHDVAMTVLPDAPIDPATGLPIPTIAVATNGGVSIIKDDGTVYNPVIGAYDQADLAFNKDWSIMSVGRVADRAFKVGLKDDEFAFETAGGNNYQYIGDLDIVGESWTTLLEDYTNYKNTVPSFIHGGSLSRLKFDKTNPERSMVNYITSTYNTGWMNGDIKMAALSDTDATELVAEGDELVTNGTFNTADGWMLLNGATISNGVLNIPDTESSGTVAVNTDMTLFPSNLWAVINFTILNSTANAGVRIALSKDSGVQLGFAAGGAYYTLDGTYTLYVPANLISQDWRLGFYRVGGHTGTLDIDNISVKEVQGIPAFQPVSTQRPTYNATTKSLELDLVDDSLVYNVPTGGIDGYMVIGTDEGTASYGVSLPEGPYEIGGDYFPGNEIHGFLLREGDSSTSELDTVENYFVEQGAKASYGDVTDFRDYWHGKGITEFPVIDTSNGTNFLYAWRDNNLTSFPLIDTSSGTSFFGAWRGNNLASFPLIDTSSGTNFSFAWFGNNNLTSFPLLDTSNGTNFSAAWYSNNLASFPLIDTSNGTDFSTAWYNNNLTSFPLIDTSNGTNFSAAWYNNNLTSFPLLDTSNGTNFASAWYGNNLTSFPLIDTSSGTNFSFAWRANDLTEFPLIDTSSGTNFSQAWRDNNLTGFPLIDTSSGTNFNAAWWDNDLTSFPALDFSSGTNFSFAWIFNGNLTDFPANMFDNCNATNFLGAFSSTNLSQSSIDGILVSIESNGKSNGTFDQTGGFAPSATGEAVIDALVTRGWTVNVTGGYQGKVLPEGLFENDENGFWYSMDIGE